jgi:hypothetical protein
MGAEVGATTSTFPYSQNMRAYLNATGRAPVAAAADAAAAQGFLSADENAEYDDVIEIVCHNSTLIGISNNLGHRTSQTSNPLSTVPSPQTWQHLYHGLEISSKKMDGKMNFLLGLLGPAQIVHMKTWYSNILRCMHCGKLTIS